MVQKYWNRALNVGFRAGMDHEQQMRLFVVNAFMLISIILTVFFITVFVSLGSYSALQGSVLIPIFILVFYLNAKGKFGIARIIVTYGLTIMALMLSLADRRTGTEYTLIAIGCCSVILYSRLSAIMASFLFAFICYVIYVWIDTTLPFTPDPSVPYLLVQNCLMFLSALAVVAQSIAFRSLVGTYSNSLQEANKEIQTVNEELKSSNEELQSFLDNMDMLVRQKSAQLKAYMDAIDKTICAVTIDLKGNFTRLNEPFTQLSGYNQKDLSGIHYSILNTDQLSPEFLKSRDETLLSGECWSGELKFKGKDGNFFWIECVVMPLRNEDGKAVEFLALGIPITERKLATELKTKTQNLLEAIAFRTSHKIRGPLTTIDGLMNLLKRHLVSQEEYDSIVKKLSDSNDELKEATSELVRFVNNHQETFHDHVRQRE